MGQDLSSSSSSSSSSVSSLSHDLPHHHNHNHNHNYNHNHNHHRHQILCSLLQCALAATGTQNDPINPIMEYGRTCQSKRQPPNSCIYDCFENFLLKRRSFCLFAVCSYPIMQSPSLPIIILRPPPLPPPPPIPLSASCTVPSNWARSSPPFSPQVKRENRPSSRHSTPRQVPKRLESPNVLGVDHAICIFLLVLLGALLPLRFGSGDQCVYVSR
jgi:hypothetical protein